MTKTRRAMSILVAVVMVVSMISSFGTVFAAGASDAADKSATNYDYLIYETMKPINNPGYGTSVPAGIVFVAEDWKTASNYQWVYFRYTESGKVYKAQYGVNAFSSLDELAGVGNGNLGVLRENLVVKFGPGTYQFSETKFTLNSSNMRFYGNYAGVNPNELSPNDPYDMVLSSKRQDDSLESQLDAVQIYWTTNSHNITFDGFKMINTATFRVGPSGKSSEVKNVFIYNNIIKNASGGLYRYWIFSDSGTKYGFVVKNNRAEDNNCTLLIGAGMADFQFENNYISNHVGKVWTESTVGNYTTEATLSYSYNYLVNCADGINFANTNAGYGINLFYLRMVGNVFNSCGGTNKSIITANYLPDNGASKITDSASKTFISDNIFYRIPKGTTAINLTGRASTLGTTVNYIVTVNNNKFLFATDTGSLAVKSTIQGTVDASRNFYGVITSEGVKSLGATDNLITVNTSLTKLIKMPYYLDEGMTTLSGAIDLQKAREEVLTASGFDASTFNVDNKKVTVSANVLDGFETVDFSNVLVGNAVTLEIYEDFLLTQKISDMKVDIADEITRAYLIATDTITGQATKFDVILLANTDKTKAELRFINNDSTYEKYTKWKKTGNTLDITLESKYVYFPFSLVVSPSATYTLYTDEALTQEYNDETYYMQPDIYTTLYAKVVSGDEATINVYTLKFLRSGDANYDARIISVVSPTENMLLFNNERKTVVYRPYGLTGEQNFDFEVSKNTTYNIYKNYNKATGELSGLLKKMGEDKTLEVPDGLNYYYIEVVNNYGYRQLYTLTMYNDVKSNDNVITGITSLDGVTLYDNNYITIDVTSDSISQVNAHFETNPFAKVTVYADQDKTFEVNPTITTETYNNREVDVRTFQLGITSYVSKFWIDVEAETGDMNYYTLTIKRTASPAKKFTDLDGHWASEYIAKANRIGIIGGYSTDSGSYIFKPNQPATRQEVAVMILRSMGVEPLSFKRIALENTFKDGKTIPDWSYNYIKGIYGLGIMTGDDQKNFRPFAYITRQEFFQAISNLLKLDVNDAANYDLSRFSDVSTLSSWAIPATKAVVKAGIVDGSNGKLNPKANITRAEIAKILTITNTVSDLFK